MTDCGLNHSSSGSKQVLRASPVLNTEASRRGVHAVFCTQPLSLESIQGPTSQTLHEAVSGLQVSALYERNHTRKKDNLSLPKNKTIKTQIEFPCTKTLTTKAAWSAWWQLKLAPTWNGRWGQNHCRQWPGGRCRPGQTHGHLVCQEMRFLGPRKQT